MHLLEQALEEAQPGHKVLHRKQAARASRLALQAEKSSLQEAERQGWLDEDDWRELSARIDSELLALHAEEKESEHREKEKGKSNPSSLTLL